MKIATFGSYCLDLFFFYLRLLINLKCTEMLEIIPLKDIKTQYCKIVTSKLTIQSPIAYKLDFQILDKNRYAAS